MRHQDEGDESQGSQERVGQESFGLGLILRLPRVANGVSRWQFIAHEACQRLLYIAQSSIGVDPRLDLGTDRGSAIHVFAANRAETLSDTPVGHGDQGNLITGFVVDRQVAQ